MAYIFKYKRLLRILEKEQNLLLQKTFEYSSPNYEKYKNCTVSCLTGRDFFHGMCGVVEGEPGERGIFEVFMPVAVTVHQRLVATAGGTECRPLIRLLVQVLNAVQEYLSCKHFRRD